MTRVKHGHRAKPLSAEIGSRSGGRSLWYGKFDSAAKGLTRVYPRLALIRQRPRPSLGFPLDLRHHTLPSSWPSSHSARKG